MAKFFSVLAAGLIFGFGLGLSHMVDPAKVLGFLDVAGAWDPSLILVMASATSVAFVAFRLASRRKAPLFEKGFMLPTVKDIDVKLMGGAVVFGVGWGLVGFCPGPAIASFAYGGVNSAIFVAAMAAGFGLTRLIPDTQRMPPASYSPS